MRPFEFMSGPSVAPCDKTGSPKPIDQTILEILILSAFYMNLPAERINQLIQQKKQPN